MPFKTVVLAERVFLLYTMEKSRRELMFDKKMFFVVAVLIMSFFVLTACSGVEPGKKIIFEDDGTDKGGFP